MRELSVEEKAKAYDKVREKIDIRFGSNVAEEIFSQFEESEDEKIRKVLIEFFGRGAKYNCSTSGISDKDILTWLEKQGEKSVDRVEPKFRVGYWIIDKENKEVFYISKNLANTYEIVDTEGNDYHVPHHTLEEDYNVWTIQDAKDGDILADSNLPFIFKKIDANKYSYAYCGISPSGGFKIKSDGESGEWTWSQDIRPATKDQRDLLFQKMKEAGYEWDAEKKELKKVEQKPAEWTEEDEQYLLVCKNALAKYQTTDKWDACIVSHWLENKLKSLKDRVLSQPKQECSEEDEAHIDSLLKRLEGICKTGATFIATRFAIREDMDWLKLLKQRIGGS